MSDLAVLDAGLAVAWLNDIEAEGLSLIARLPSMPDEEVIAVCVQASALGALGWRVECAAHAELVSRQNARQGRGRYDTEGQGIAKVVKQIASETDTTPKTIYKNAEIWRNFLDPSSNNVVTREMEHGSLSHLRDKGYFLAALESDDPHGTLEAFALRKTDDRRFSVSDAFRFVREGKTPPLDDYPPNFIDTPEAQAAYARWQEATRALQRAVPVWRGMLDALLEEVAYEAGRPSQTWRERIVEHIITYSRTTVQQLRRALGLDQIRCQVMLNRLCEDGTLKCGDAERTAGARGAAQKEYWLSDEDGAQ